MGTTTGITAEAVIETLRAAGIRRMSLFGSVAGGKAGPESDVDLAVELLPEPVEKPRLSANIERDRGHVFR